MPSQEERADERVDAGTEPRIILVRHVMATDPVTASPDLNAGDAAGLMAANDVGAIPIVDDGRLVGLVTDRDLVLRVLADRTDPRTFRLGDIATTQRHRHRHTVHAAQRGVPRWRCTGSADSPS